VRFIDTNVFLRFLTGDDAAKAEACRALLTRIGSNQEDAFTSETVVAEVFYVLTRSRGGYRVDRVELAQRMRPLLHMSGMAMPAKTGVLRALEVYEAHPDLDFEDALSVAHMEGRSISEIVSYDRGFDSVAGVTRIEP
jgi:predicted nucleic acid-binding protein